MFILREFGVCRPTGGNPEIPIVSGITGPEGLTGRAPYGAALLSGNPMLPSRGDRDSFMLNDRDTPRPGVREPAADPYEFVRGTPARDGAAVDGIGTPAGS